MKTKPALKTITGTSHFVNFLRARQYYRAYDPSLSLKELNAWVKRKLDEGEIHLGKPVANPGETVTLNDEEGRYFIEA